MKRLIIEIQQNDGPGAKWLATILAEQTEGESLLLDCIEATDEETALSMVLKSLTEMDDDGELIEELRR